MHDSAATMGVVNPRQAAMLALLSVISFLTTACDGDPYRIGAEPATNGGVVVHFANCDDDRISRVTLTRSGEPRDVLWEVRSVNTDGEAVFAFPVGSQPPGFELTVPLSTVLPDGHDLVMIDSTFLEDQRFSFNRARLRDGHVFAGNNEQFTVEEFKAAALCDQ